MFLNSFFFILEINFYRHQLIKMNSNDVNWIENELIPQLINSGQLTVTGISSQPIVNSLVVNKLSTSEGFMLTNCYRIHATLSDASDKSITNEYKLVAKVYYYYCHTALH